MRLLRDVLRNRDLALIELVWLMATVVRWALAIVVSIYVYRAAGAGAVGLSAVARIAPAALLAPQLGLIADRYSRRQVLLWSAITRLLLIVAMCAAVAADSSVVIVVTLAAAWAVADVVQRPAQMGLMAATAKNPGELAAANALLSTLENAGVLIGALAVGTIVALWGLVPAFIAWIPPLIVAVVAMACVTRDHGLGRDADTATGHELAAGLRTVAHNRDLRTLVALRVMHLFTEALLDVVLIVVALGLLSMGEQGAGWLNAGWGIGGICGGLLATALLARQKLAAGLRWGMLIAGIPLVVLGLWPDAGLAIALMVVVGSGLALIDTALLTLGQRLVAADVMSRVFGFEETVGILAMALGSLAASGVIAVFGEDGALICTGLLLPAVAALRWARLRRFDSDDTVDQGVFELLRGVPAFANLPVATVESLSLRSSSTSMPGGTVIIEQGETGDEFFVIESGEVEVWESGQFRRIEETGDYFGEIALLRDVPRTATVSARSDVELLVLDRAEFLAAVGTHVRTKRDLEAVADERLAGATD